MIRRKRYDKLPLQANFYPVPTMAYIQVIAKIFYVAYFHLTLKGQSHNKVDEILSWDNL
jgi:hypothetical protein